MIDSVRSSIAELLRGDDKGGGEDGQRILLQLGNPGLVLQRLLPMQPEDKGGATEHPYAQHVAAIASWSVPADYREAYVRWLNLLERARQLRMLDATATGPVAVGLGIASPIENGLALHYTYGVPFLPGSALKGLARRMAQQMDLPEEDQRVLFGGVEQAGHLVFWDAWLDPDTAAPTPFARDVVTPHHPGYYRTRGERPPTDFDDPKPAPFLSVRPGARFTVAVSSESAGSGPWVELALNLLEEGLVHMGVGGKTNAGYGYFKVRRRMTAAEARVAEEKRRQALDKYGPEIDRIQQAAHLSIAENLLRELGKEEPEVRVAALRRLREQMIQKSLWDEQDRRVRKLQEMLEEADG